MFASQYKRYFWRRFEVEHLTFLLVNVCGIERHSGAVSAPRFRLLRYRLIAELGVLGVAVPAELQALRLPSAFSVTAWHRRLGSRPNPSFQRTAVGRR